MLFTRAHYLLRQGAKCVIVLPMALPESILSQEISPSDEARRRLRPVERAERASHIAQDFDQLRRWQRQVSETAMEVGATPELMAQQSILSSHARVLAAMSADSSNHLAFCLPKPMAVAVEVHRPEESDISLVGNEGEKISMSNILAGITQSEPF